MIKIEREEAFGWGAAIRGMRNPMNSWDKSDSYPVNTVIKTEEIAPGIEERYYSYCDAYWHIGDNDAELMKKLRNSGTPDHRKFMRMLIVYIDITAPLYWWKEFDTYKVGTVANSCSTMHKIQAKEFTMKDFSTEHLFDENPGADEYDSVTDGLFKYHMSRTIAQLNVARKLYLETKDKKYWWQMIQLLPSSYNQKRTVMLNYEVLANIYKSRKNHKLDEWHDFCRWIEQLPYSELITGEVE